VYELNLLQVAYRASCFFGTIEKDVKSSSTTNLSECFKDFETATKSYTHFLVFLFSLYLIFFSRVSIALVSMMFPPSFYSSSLEISPP